MGDYHGTRGIAPFVNRTFERGVAIATVLSVWSIVPRHCAHLTCCLHPKLRKCNAVLITPQLKAVPLRRLRSAGSIPIVHDWLPSLHGFLCPLFLLLLLSSCGPCRLSALPPLALAQGGLSRRASTCTRSVVGQHRDCDSHTAIVPCGGVGQFLKTGLGPGARTVGVLSRGAKARKGDGPCKRGRAASHSPAQQLRAAQTAWQSPGHSPKPLLHSPPKPRSACLSPAPRRCANPRTTHHTPPPPEPQTSPPL